MALHCLLVVNMIPFELERVLSNEGLKPSGRLIRQNTAGIIRYHVEGDNNAKANGWIHLFDGGANFGSWATGQSGTWFEEGAVKLDKNEIQRRKQVANESIRSIQNEAANKAKWIIENAKPCHDNNAYLTRKQVKSFGLYVYKDAAVVPIFNIDGKIRSAQFINDDGTKTFLGGGEIEGCFFVIGWKSCGVTVICEGYSTGATIHQATGLPVIIAFNSGNLPHVAKRIRAKLGKTASIIIAADNDRELAIRKPKVGNIGVKKGYEAAMRSRGHLIYPSFNEGEHGSDFNDLGEERTKKIFDRIV